METLPTPKAAETDVIARAVRALGGTRALAARLAAALDRGCLRVEFQPKVSLTSGSLIGVEALARWTDPELGVIQLQVFIPWRNGRGASGS